MATIHIRASRVAGEGGKEGGLVEVTLCGRRDVSPTEIYGYGHLAEKEAQLRGDGTSVCQACLDAEESRQTTRR